MIRQFTSLALSVAAFALLSFQNAPLRAPQFNPTSVLTDTISKSSSESISGNFTMSENGWLHGLFSSTFNGLAKIQERNRYLKTDNKEKYIAGMLPFEDVRVDSFGLSDVELLDQPLKRLVYCHIPLELRKLGEMQTFNLPIQTEFSYNPFDMEANNDGNFTVPLDVKNQFTLTISLPESLTIEAKPENKNVVMAGTNNKLQFMSAVNNNALQIVFKIQIAAGNYTAKEFEELKNWAEQLKQKKYETVILRRKSDWASKPEKKN
jgi:hypothetical protein